MKIEQQLLGKNSAKLSSSKVSNENDLNASIEKVKSIDQSLEILRNIPSHDEEHPEVISVSGAKLNKLWKRLTGNSTTTKFNPTEHFSYNKENFSQLYEEARQFVLQSNFEEVLDISHIHHVNNNKTKVDDDAKSEVSTMNSIANIETEEEYPGSYEQQTSTTTKSTETSPPKFENLTFEVPRIISPEQIQTIPENLNTSIGLAEMEIDNTNNYSNSSFEKIDSSSVDKDGSIIPEIINSPNSQQITDMDESYEQEQDQLIEDISFPDYETSLSIREESDENNRNNLSTITECTEYEQSPGSSEIYTATTSSSTTTSTGESSSKNIEIQNRLISINESLSEVNEAFDRVVKPLSLSKTHSSDTSSKTSENTIQFSEHDVIGSTKKHEKSETISSSSSSSSTSDF